LGRSLQLSDDPLIEQMKTGLAGHGYRFSSLVEAIVTSPQFRNRRSAAQPESPSTVARSGKGVFHAQEKER